MAKNTELWNEVEDKLKSLTSSLQSLPSEMREKALHFITKEISSEETNRSKVKDKATPTVSETRGTPIKVLPKKRVQPNENGHTDDTSAASPSSSSAVEPKKRGRPRLNRSLEKVESETETEIRLPKKRGRPRKSATLPTSLNTRDGDEEDTVNEVVPRSSSRVRRKPKTYIEEDENLFNDHVQKDGEGSVILVPVDENDLSDAINHVASSLNDDDDEDDTDENYDFNEHSQMEKRKKSGKAARKSSASESGDTEEELSPVKKRGRPRKKDFKSRKESDIDPDFLSDTSIKKTIGRPRFSSYVSGYIPKPKIYKCTECGKNLSSRASLREHVRRHTGDLYMCDLCGQKFSTNSGFLLHKKYHSNDPTVFKCTHCRYTVSTRQLLDEHFQTRHDPNRPREHICYVCGKGFHTAIQLEKHLVSHSGIKPYVCDECDFSTAYAGGLEKHKYNVHEKEHRRLFECELCHVKLRSRGTYNEHLGRHFNQRNKKCEICQKTFPTASQLASHRRCHTDPKIPCEVCGKLLRNKHKMKVHMYLHTGQKDFACPYCSYVTYVKHNLKKHCVVRHKVEYPPVNHPRMKKFRAEHARTIAASLSDPVAVRCIQKMVHSSDEDEENVQEDTLELCAEQRESSNPEVLPNERNTDSSATFHPSMSGNVLINSVQQDTVVSQLEAGSYSRGVECKAEMSGEQTSMITDVVPIYTLPLFSYGLQGNFISTAASTSCASSSVEGKRYITLTTANMGSNQPTAIVITPTFNTLG